MQLYACNKNILQQKQLIKYRGIKSKIIIIILSCIVIYFKAIVCHELQKRSRHGNIGQVSDFN